MNSFIVGATRGIGRQLLDQALAAGHTVTALVRDRARLNVRHERLKVVTGDIRDARSVDAAMPGQDTVFCTIGVRLPGLYVSVFSEGTKNLLAAMKRTGVKRLVCVTGIGAGDSKGHGGVLYDCFVLPFLFRTVYADKDRQEAIIRASDCAWTIVRPGFLTNGPLTGRYQALTDLTGVTAGWISRADVAHFMLRSIALDEYVGKTPLLTS